MSRLFFLPVRTPRSGSQKIVLTFRSNTVFTKEIGRQVARHNCFPSGVFFLSLYHAVYVSCQCKRGNTELFHIITTRRRDQQQPQIRLHSQAKGRTIRKVMRGGGGMGKKPKRNSCKGKCQEKNSCKEEGKEKKFLQKEGPIVIFI